MACWWDKILAFKSQKNKLQPWYLQHIQRHDIWMLQGMGLLALVSTLWIQEFQVRLCPITFDRLPETSIMSSPNRSVSNAIKAETATASRRSTYTESNSDSPSTTNFHKVSILKELSPIPDASSRRRTHHKMKSQQSKMFTSSPYTAAVEEMAQQKLTARTR